MCVRLSGRGEISSSGRLHFRSGRQAGAQDLWHQDVAFRLRRTIDFECRTVRVAEISRAEPRIGWRTRGAGGADAPERQAFPVALGPAGYNLHPGKKRIFWNALGSARSIRVSSRIIRKIAVGGFVAAAFAQGRTGIRAGLSPRQNSADVCGRARETVFCLPFRPCTSVVRVAQIHFLQAFLSVKRSGL